MPPVDTIEHDLVRASRADQHIATIVGGNQRGVMRGQLCCGVDHVIDRDRRTIRADNKCAGCCQQRGFERVAHAFTQIAFTLKRKVNAKTLLAGRKKNMRRARRTANFNRPDVSLGQCLQRADHQTLMQSCRRCRTKHGDKPRLHRTGNGCFREQHHAAQITLRHSRHDAD